MAAAIQVMCLCHSDNKPTCADLRILDQIQMYQWDFDWIDTVAKRRGFGGSALDLGLSMLECVEMVNTPIKTDWRDQITGQGLYIYTQLYTQLFKNIVGLFTIQSHLLPFKHKGLFCPCPDHVLIFNLKPPPQK